MVWNKTASIVQNSSLQRIVIGVPYEVKVTMMWAMKTMAPLLFTSTNWCEKIPQMARGVPQSVARDQIVDQALLDPLVTHILWVDSDSICESPEDPNVALNMLYQCNVPIVSGLYRAKQKQGFNYAAWMDAKLPDNKPGFVPIESYTGNFFQVDTVGMGFCLVKREVYERLSKPWYPWPTHSPSEDFNFCVLKDTLVYGNNIVPIETLNIGDTVLTCEGLIKTVTNIMHHEYQGILKRLKTFGSDATFTPNHPILIRRDKNISWVKSENVCRGDYIFIPKIQRDVVPFYSLSLPDYVDISKCSITNDGKVYYKKTHTKAPRILPDIKITKDLMRLFGYYIAEGCTGSKNNCIIFVFNKSETEYCNDVINLLTNLFGATSTISYNGNVIRITCSSKIIAELFTYLFGHLARNKHLPWFFNRLDNECLSELIKGCWRGDGNKNGFGYHTVSKILAHQIRMSLLRLGILASVKGNSNRGRGYSINVSTKYHGDFSRIIGIGKGVNSSYHSYPWRNYIVSDSPQGFWLKVKNIEDVQYEGLVYNISVNNSESYIADGIGVHNCIQAKKYGYDINVFTDVKISHIGDLIVKTDGSVSVLEI